MDEIAKLAKVDTRRSHVNHLACLSQLVINVALLEKDKPTIVENEFESFHVNEDGLALINKRFKSRIRKSALVRRFLHIFFPHPTEAPLDDDRDQ